MSAARAGRRAPGRNALGPLVGSLLIGTAFPVFGAADSLDSAPLPRLRLALVLESLTAESRPGAPGTEAVALSPIPPGLPEAPRLRLATSLLSRPPSPPSAPPGTPSGPIAVSNPPIGPSPDDERRERPAALPPPRQDPPSKAKPGDRASAPNDGKDRADAGRAAEPAALPKLAASVETASGGNDAAVVGADEFLPADEVDVPLPATPPPKPGAVPSPEAAAAGNPGRRWGIPPIRWGGEISGGFRRRGSDEAGSSTEQVYEGRLRANSYILQPYIALVSGDFGLTMVRSQDSSAASSNLTGTSINGTGTLSVFPQSRFPFQASLALSDSRSDGSLTATNTERRRLSLRQDYRPQVGGWSTSGQYDRSELTGSFGTDTVDRLSASFNSMFDKHSFSSNGSFSRNESTDQSTDDFFVLGTHGYRLSEATTIDTTASYSRQDFELGDTATQLGGSTQSAQIFSYASWTPAESPWRGTGNLRYFQTNNSIGGSSFNGRTFGGSASLSYVASRNLNLFGTLGANSTGDGQTSTNQSVGLSYSGDPLTFGNNNVYNWFGSTSVSNATSSEEVQRSANMSVGHSLNRTWQPSENTFLSGSLNQSLGSSLSTGVGSVSSRTLSHGASLSLQANAGDNLSGFLSTSVSDSRVSGESPSSFQMLNVQLSGRWRINAYSEMNSNLTWQLSHQESEDQNDFLLTDEFGRPIIVDHSTRSQNSSISGNLGYSHTRFFGLRGLRYTADFRANTARDNARRRGDPDAEREPDRATLDLDQRLRYSIGRLDTELQLRVAEIEGRRSDLVFFRVSRHFGAF
jgi:hypothetical protein